MVLLLTGPVQRTPVWERVLRFVPRRLVEYTGMQGGYSITTQNDTEPLCIYFLLLKQNLVFDLVG